MRRAIFALTATTAIALGTTVAACSNGSGGSAPAAAAPAAGSGAWSPNPPVGTNVTGPWAVVSAYYGDIESGNYQQAWALIGAGPARNQTYHRFVAGFACTGQQDLTEVSESADQVTFDLAVTDSCSGQVQNFIGTDTVLIGKIAAVHVQSTG